MPNILIKSKDDSFGFQNRTVTINKAQAFLKSLPESRRELITLFKVDYLYEGTKRTLISKTKITESELFIL